MKTRISAIIQDSALQIRAGMNDGTVQEYTERMTEGETFPPVIVWKDGDDHLLIDGYHRMAAMKAAGFTDCEVKVFTGTKAEALIAAMLANRNHGLPMTRTDKRQAVKRILDASSDMSSRAIAEAVGVSNHTVDAIRSELGNSPSQRVGKDGVKRMVKTPRLKAEEADDEKDDGQDAPPEDPGIGGASLSPESCADKGGITKDQVMWKLDSLINWAAENAPEDVTADLMAVKAYVGR